MARIGLMTILHEEFGRKKPREQVDFRCLNNLRVLEQFNRMMHAREDDFGHVVGLCEKVRRAELEASDFSGFFARKHDDRNLFELRALLDEVQHFVTVDLGHEQIEKYERY